MKVVIALMVLCLSVMAFAGSGDVVRMNSGKVYTGHVVKEVPNKYVEIRLQNGKSKKLKWALVKNINRRSLAADADEYSEESNAHFDFGLGFQSSTGVNGFGVDVGGFFRLGESRKIHLGLETGLSILGGTANTGLNYLVGATGLEMALPILASLICQIGEDGDLTPYVGMSSGLWIGLSNSIGARLVVLLKPGVFLQLSDGLNFLVEARFGGVDGLWFLNPRGAISIQL